MLLSYPLIPLIPLKYMCIPTMHQSMPLNEMSQRTVLSNHHSLSKFPWQWWSLNNNQSWWNSLSLFPQRKYIAQHLLFDCMQNWGHSQTHTFRLFISLLLHRCNFSFPCDELLMVKVCYFAISSHAEITDFNISVPVSDSCRWLMSIVLQAAATLLFIHTARIWVGLF